VLHVFGVLPRTEAVYSTMLAHPRADIAEIAGLMSLPEEIVSAELAELADLMLVEVDRLGPLVAIPPDQAIEALIAREEARIAAAQRQMTEARESLGEFVTSFVESRSHRDAAGQVEQIDDPRVVTSRLFQLTRGASTRVSFMLPGEALPQEALEPSSRLDDDLLRRRIPLRTIVTASSLTSPHWKAHLRSQVSKGAHIRSHASPPLRVVVIDNDIAVLPRDGCPGAVIIHGRDLVVPAAALFDEVWQDSLAVSPSDAEGEETDISEARIRQVVTLLAQGHKDETIARRLGVSVRTVRRFVSAAVASLHAESRFQAGVLAVRRGWVP
jgi:DNA-binding CsgD family transcriptional regulator